MAEEFVERARSIAAGKGFVSLVGMQLDLAEVELVHGRAEDWARVQSYRERFDLVLMSESNCYFSIEDGFRQCDQLLRPGGEIMIANFLPEIPDVGYMEAFMDWQLIYRTRWEVMELTKGIPEADISDIHCFSDPDNKNIVFLQVTKN